MQLAPATMNSPTPAAALSPTSTIPPKKLTTVGEMEQRNLHVNNLPSSMKKNDSTVVSDAERQAHMVIQALLSSGISASVTPALYKNLTYTGYGIGFGFVLGIGLRVFSTAQVDTRLQNFKNWFERSAAMNSITKTALGALHVGFISANTLANFTVTMTDTYALLQGIIAGVHTGFEISGAAMSSLHQILEGATAPPDQSSDPMDNDATLIPITNPSPNSRNISHSDFDISNGPLTSAAPTMQGAMVNQDAMVSNDSHNTDMAIDLTNNPNPNHIINISDSISSSTEDSKNQGEALRTV